MRTYYILLMMLFCTCFGTGAMAQELPQETIIGTWVLDYDGTFSKMEEQMKVALDSVPQAHRSGIEDSYRGRTMVFGPNSDFKLLFPDGREVGGSWALEQNGNVLVLTDPNGHRYPHKVKELTSNSMALKMEDSEGSKLFVKDLYFIKN